jgi:tetratricopeptide (TPR) repeat protein
MKRFCKLICSLFIAIALVDAVSTFSVAADDRKLCASTNGRADQIIAACKRIITANPGDVPIVLRLANIFSERKQYNECTDVLSKGISANITSNNSTWLLFYDRAICREWNGQWDSAEPDLKKALELNPDEPLVLNNLGYSWIDRNIHIDEALRMIQRAVEKQPNNGDFADSLGWAYYRTGHYNKAVKNLERAVRLKPDESTINDHLGDVYAKLGRISEARIQWILARNLQPEPDDLKKIEKKIASTPDVQSTKSTDNTDISLACRPGSTAIDISALRPNTVPTQQRFESLLYQEANPVGALAEAQRLEALVRTLLGMKDLRYASALSDMADACSELFAFEQAEALYKQSLAIREQAPPNASRQHNITRSLADLGDLYSRQGRDREAMEFFKRALAIDENAREPNRDDVASDLNDLAELLNREGNYEEAERLFMRALPMKEAAWGSNHWSVGVILNNLANVYVSQGRYAEAAALYRRALPIYEAHFGASHPQVSIILSNLADAQKGELHFGDAEAFYRRALGILEKTYGQSNPRVGQVLMEIGDLHALQHKYDQAERELRQALASIEAVGADNSEVGMVLDHLGSIVGSLNRYGEAETLLQRALKIREQNLGPNDPNVAATLDNLSIVYSESNDAKRALDYSRKATAIVIAHAATETAGIQEVERPGGFVSSRADYFRRLVVNLAVAAQKGLEPASVLRGEALEMAQWAIQSSAATAVQQLGLRFASGNNALASLVRERQDLASKWHANNNLLVAALSRPDLQRSAAAVHNFRQQIQETENKLAIVSAQLEREFPEYAALASPKPLKVEEVQKLLNADEALVFF